MWPGRTGTDRSRSPSPCACAPHQGAQKRTEAERARLRNPRSRRQRPSVFLVVETVGRVSSVYGTPPERTSPTKSGCLVFGRPASVRPGATNCVAPASQRLPQTETNQPDGVSRSVFTKFGAEAVENARTSQRGTRAGGHPEFVRHVLQPRGPSTATVSQNACQVRSSNSSRINSSSKRRSCCRDGQRPRSRRHRPVGVGSGSYATTEPGLRSRRRRAVRGGDRRRDVVHLVLRSSGATRGTCLGTNPLLRNPAR